MTFPTIEQRAARPYLGISGRITDGVPAFVDKAFPELFGGSANTASNLRGRRSSASASSTRTASQSTTSGARGGRWRARAHSRRRSIMHVGPYRETPTSAVEPRAAGQEGGRRGSSTAVVGRALSIGPLEEPDFTKWQTEFAFLVLDE